MKKKWFISAAVFAAALSPRIAMAAADEAEQPGSWRLLIFFAINFGLFVWVLIRFAVPLARKFFADRAQTIGSGLSRAQSAFAEAQDIANKAAAKMAAIEAELKKMAADFDEETAFQVAKVGELAKSTVERIKRDAELSASALSEAARRRVRARLAESAATLARELIGRNFQSNDQGRLIDGFMDQLGDAGARR
jgi:F0F1-type ATP synthase membrane subunit b/b'